MEEKCIDEFESIAVNLTRSSYVEPSSSVNLLYSQNYQLQQPSTSHSSMSLLQEDFGNSQHDFADVLDDETTTSGVLETFEISSSNSLPTCTNASAPVAVADDSSSTDTIKLLKISDSTATDGCDRKYFNSSEVYIINDDDDFDDDDDDDNESANADVEAIEGDAGSEIHTKATSKLTTGGSYRESTEHINGVIMSTSGAMIFVETPIIEEQQHHPQVGTNDEVEFDKNAVKPKRLSDEFLNNDDTVEVPTSSTNGSKRDIEESSSNNVAFDLIESQMCLESQQERMSSCLKKMNINNYPTSLDLPSSSSQTQMSAPMADIESMDFIERRDFETEQRLTGGIILKSSSLVNKDKLNLGLIKSCMGQGGQTVHTTEECASDSGSSSGSGTGSGPNISSNNISNRRAVSSDSKCTYKDLSTTPTSSRKFNSRLTKSTAKMNLCTTLSHHSQKQDEQKPSQHNHHQRNSVGTELLQVQKSILSTTTSGLSTSSVIVEGPSTSASASISNGGSVSAEIFSNSNSNDSLLGGASSVVSSASSNVKLTHCRKEAEEQVTSVMERTLENGCSRTSAVQQTISSNSIANNKNSDLIDDVQPSTSSARCQYAPPLKGLRQVHASAQTNERYLARANVAGSSTMGGSNSNSVVTSGSLGGAIVGVNLSVAASNRRRIESVAPFRRNSTSNDVIAAFKMMTETSALPEHIDYNEDPSWVDCEENNSDVEEICTCHHSGSSSSSHGGSLSSLNETDDFDGSNICGKDGDLSNYILHNLSISEEASAPPDCQASSFGVSTVQQRKRKYNDGRIIESDYNSTAVVCNGVNGGADVNRRKRIAYDFTSTPRTSQSNAPSSLDAVPTPSSQLVSTTSSPIGRRTPRSVIPTRENPPPELQHWLAQFQRWSHAERLLAVDRLIEHCEPTQVRHMMKVIEPQFQRDFISLLPRELALQVLAYLDPKDLLRAAQTCRSWQFLCDDNLLWKEKCRKAQILTESRTDRPKRGRAGNMPPIASPWKAAYMRQHIIEMNWRSRPVREPKVLKGHDDHVITCLQFSGNRIVSGSDDNTLKVWSAVTGRCLRTLVGHTGGVWSSQMSGNIIISGSTDRTLKVWDMETGQCVHTLLGHTSTVRCMHLHGNKVVSGSRDATLRVWDIEQGTCLHVLVGHLAAVRCVQYDGKLIVSGAYDYMVKIWHPERQECLHTLQGHTNRVYSLQFDGLHVVSGSLDTSIRVWDVETGNCKHTLMGHQSLTSGMELRQNILVSGNADSTVKVWDITTGQCLQTLSGPNKHQSAVTCLQFNSRFVVTSSDDGTVKLWDVKTGEFIRNLVSLESGGSGGVVWRIRANDTKLICAVGSRNGTEETKLMVLDFDVEGACVKCS